MIASRHSVKRTGRAWRGALRLAMWVALLLLKYLPPSLEVFLHRNFGARYFGRITGSIVIFWVFYEWSICSVPHSTDRALLVLYAGGLVFLGIVHFLITFIRGLRGAEDAHSRFAGLSWALRRPFSAESLLVHRLAEPMCCFCLGLFLSRIAPLFAFWLRIASIALFLKGAVEWWVFRNRVFDAIDGRIEAAQVNARVQRRSSPFARSKDQFYEVSSTQQ